MDKLVCPCLVESTNQPITNLRHGEKMTRSFSEFSLQLTTLLKKLTLGKKIALLTLIGSTILGFIFVMTWAGRPDGSGCPGAGHRSGNRYPRDYDRHREGINLFSVDDAGAQ
jgi:hypothetical protein